MNNSGKSLLKKTEAEMCAEADALAYEILMPAKMVNAHVTIMGGVDIRDDRSVGELADKFRVDIAVMTKRLIDLGLA